MGGTSGNYELSLICNRKQLLMSFHPCRSSPSGDLPPAPNWFSGFTPGATPKFSSFTPGATWQNRRKRQAHSSSRRSVPDRKSDFLLFIHGYFFHPLHSGCLPPDLYGLAATGGVNWVPIEMTSLCGTGGYDRIYRDPYNVAEHPDIPSEPDASPEVLTHAVLGEGVRWCYDDSAICLHILTREVTVPFGTVVSPLPFGHCMPSHPTV